jgi:predicted transcriptional regulator
MPRSDELSRRERQIMDVLYAASRATVSQVQERIPQPPSYSAVRALLRILEEKGHVRHEQDGPRYVYVPVVAAKRAQRSAVSHMVRTLFQGSAEMAVAALLQGADTRLSDSELDRIARLVEEARRKGEKS